MALYNKDFYCVMCGMVMAFALAMCPDAYATTMCVHTNSYVATVSRSLDGTGGPTVAADGLTFSLDFGYRTSSRTNDYRTMTGQIMCYNDTGASGGVENTADPAMAMPGEFMPSGFPASDYGEHCWCRTVTPLVSEWIFIHTYADISDCQSNCATECGNRLKTSSAFRTIAFDTVWQSAE